MGFQFKIEAVYEVYRDPHGHYHHWTVLFGKLIEGTVSAGDKIKIPMVGGTVLVARVGGFDSFDRSSNRSLSEVSVGQFASEIGMMTWHPAAHEFEIARDVALDCPTEEFQSLLLENLQHHPTRIFHNRGIEASESDCGECARVIPYTPEAVTILQNLQSSEDPYMARRASLVLQWWAEALAEKSREEPRKSLFSFWKKK